MMHLARDDLFFAVNVFFAHCLTVRFHFSGLLCAFSTQFCRKLEFRRISVHADTFSFPYFLSLHARTAISYRSNDEKYWKIVVIIHIEI